jgi:uncharacterized protein involved in exopolysaccharide biosynthesis
MELLELDSAVDRQQVGSHPAESNWINNAFLLWNHRRTLARVGIIALVLGLLIAFIIPKRYESSGRIMPPDQSGSGGGAVLAALAGKSLGGLGGLGGLAGSLLGSRNSSALFVDLLRSGTIADHLMNRYDLQHVYRKKYRVDAAKYLARHTTIVDDKKSGVITVSVEDTDPRRARDLAQGYLQELNTLVTQTANSSAHQERVFVEGRLASVRSELEHAQLALSEFSSTHSTIDIKEQTRAMVDAAAKLQGQLIVGQSETDSLKQIYGDGNVRVRAAQARVADLQHELTKMSGTSAQLPADTGDNTKPPLAGKSDDLYPPLRQLPRLAVPYADLYRTVRVQETVFELLTQEYEMARIQEAKDVPIVSVIDAPGIPEKKSYPPRLIVVLVLTLLSLVTASLLLIARESWRQIDSEDSRKRLMREITRSLQARIHPLYSKSGDTH